VKKIRKQDFRKECSKNEKVDYGSLYRALKERGNPEGKTIEKILDNLGYEIRFVKRKRGIGESHEKRNKKKRTLFELEDLKGLKAKVRLVKKQKLRLYRRPKERR
jgi:hypothetical protein